jgi:hypothetical protein
LAWIVHCAGVLTSLGYACKFGRTILVNTTLWLLGNDRLCARNITISFQRWSTRAFLQVVVCSTYGSQSTSWFNTKGQTFFSLSSLWIVTFFIVGTIIVCCAFDFYAFNTFISLQTRRTIANCCMEFYFAESPATTNCSNAGIYAFF